MLKQQQSASPAGDNTIVEPALHCQYLNTIANAILGTTYRSQRLPLPGHIYHKLPLSVQSIARLAH